jgi:hypothetical protein
MAKGKSGDDASTVILDYFAKQNRPYSVSKKLKFN